MRQKQRVYGETPVGRNPGLEVAGSAPRRNGRLAALAGVPVGEPAGTPAGNQSPEGRAPARRVNNVEARTGPRDSCATVPAMLYSAA